MRMLWLNDTRQASRVTVGEVLLILALLDLRKQMGRSRLSRDHSPLN